MGLGSTWVEESCLQGSLEGHKKLRPLVGPLQAVLEVFHGRPGVREVCRERPVLARAHVANTHCVREAWLCSRHRGPRCARRPTLNELKGRGIGRWLPGRWADLG